MSNVTVSAQGIVLAILAHGCMASIDPPQPTRMSDTTYVVRFLNGVRLCDITKIPACSEITERFP